MTAVAAAAKKRLLDCLLRQAACPISTSTVLKQVAETHHLKVRIVAAATTWWCLELRKHQLWSFENRQLTAPYEG